MTEQVRDAYDAMAERYAAFVRGDLDRAIPDRDWLAKFAALASNHPGVVADVGCGPGHVVNHLRDLGVAAVGYDISPGQIEQARLAFPQHDFHEGDLTSLAVPDSSLGGIVSRYSLIHVQPDRLAEIFTRWIRSLEPGAPVLVSFFAAPTAEEHGSPFDHAVVTAYAWYPETLLRHLTDAGFEKAETGLRSPIGSERPLDHATILARRPAP